MSTLTDRIRAEHEDLRPHVDQLRITADAVGATSVDVLRELTEACLRFIVHDLIPHADSEGDVLYEAVAKVFGSSEATATMVRDHVEVRRYAEELSTLHGSLMAGHRLTEDLARDLRRILYGLYAIVTLHFAKEDEVYATVLSARLAESEEARLLERLSHK